MENNIIDKINIIMSLGRTVGFKENGLDVYQYSYGVISQEPIKSYNFFDYAKDYKKLSYSELLNVIIKDIQNDNNEEY